ncbi:uncharacterized protein LOC142538924 isoform X2 [Primulina tabacum]|uniref:uncharacterized protein LOC142538924 isoform X2 n=1 Tax=Primulina tabacum TaxID=48773 RepID=UPI003F5A0993
MSQTPIIKRQHVVQRGQAFATKNTPRDLLDLMRAGILDPEAAFINASFILDIFPVLAAAHKTVIAKSLKSLTTLTLHSELVYNFSISESLKRCGISDSTNYILVARFGDSADEMTTIKGLVKGNEIDLGELETRANQAHIQKRYKISEQELGISSLADDITCRIVWHKMHCEVKTLHFNVCVVNHLMKFLSLIDKTICIIIS